MSLFHKAQRWLDRAPVRDALDRHSSAGLQIVVLLSTAAALALLSSLLKNPTQSKPRSGGRCSSLPGPLVLLLAAAPRPVQGCGGAASASLLSGCQFYRDE